MIKDAYEAYGLYVTDYSVHMTTYFFGVCLGIRFYLDVRKSLPRLQEFIKVGLKTAF